jgi:hypothetical protein
MENPGDSKKTVKQRNSTKNVLKKLIKKNKKIKDVIYNI